MSGGHGFQFTPFGVLPIGVNPSAGDEPAPAVVPRTSGADRIEVPAYVPSAAIARPAAPLTPITGKTLLAQARARLRELDRDVPRLIAERDELRRLVDAAKKPRAVKPKQH